MRPQAVPPLRAMCRYLTRRTRVDVTTAQALWLAGCLSCYTRLVAQGYDLEIAPLLSPSLLPELPSPFSEAHVGSYPAILDGVEGLGDRAARQLYLKSMESQVEVQLRATHAALRFYQSRRSPRIPSKLVPTLNELRIAHRTVLQRSIMLPVDCVASSPGDVADLFEKRPELDAIPSLVPVVDIIRSPAALRTSQHAAGPSSSDPTTSAGSLPTNCALYTCVQAAFLSSGTRRRVLLETSPLSNRRVVVCATKEISAGEELLMSYGS
ncbi:unnamed protein product [Trypanosoma congolense IL3000]|uniref:WGS project CAEQ00000000 data, annotated contig 1378 n=1 Tax=Trypanosoma congolense (strain IL3000) TaxID=1068625 RepID=F9W5U2_TRYCI|nr:unnamed protein product [Trypanosoma congolense IL3000]